MKRKWVVCITMAAATVLAGQAAMAESQTEAEVSAAPAGTSTGYELGMWIPFSETIDGEEQGVSSNDQRGFYQGQIFDSKGRPVEGQTYTVEGDTFTLYENGEEMLSGTVTFSDFALSEEDKANLPEKQLAEYEKCEYDAMTLTAMRLDNSNPLAPSESEWSYTYVKSFFGSDYRQFLLQYLENSTWDLSTGVEMEIDAEGNVSLNSGITGSVRTRGDDDAPLVFSFSGTDDIEYSVDFISMTDNSFEMTPVDEDGNVTGDVVVVTRK